MANYQYRLTKITTDDYGDNSPIYRMGMLSVIPDGSHWTSRPATFNLSVPADAKCGDLYAVSITATHPKGQP